MYRVKCPTCDGIGYIEAIDADDALYKLQRYFNVSHLCEADKVAMEREVEKTLQVPCWDMLHYQY